MGNCSTFPVNAFVSLKQFCCLQNRLKQFDDFDQIIDYIYIVHYKIENWNISKACM